VEAVYGGQILADLLQKVAVQDSDRAEATPSPALPGVQYLNTLWWKFGAAAADPPVQEPPIDDRNPVKERVSSIECKWYLSVWTWFALTLFQPEGQ
jgi:hypothetical protein